MAQCTAPAHQVSGEGLALGVPEGVDEDFVVLDGDRAHGGAKVKRPTLEHDTVLVVDAGALREYQQRRRVRRLHVRFHALRHYQPILHLRFEGCRPSLPVQ